MMKARRLLGAAAATLLAVFVLAGPIGATSLWGNSVSLFSDVRAQNVGDLVTLIIAEQTRAEQNAQTRTGQESSVNLGPGVGILSNIIPELRIGGGDNARAAGSTTRGGSLVARMTTRVTEILPNGNMVIEGYQLIQINGEEQILRVKGIIRPQDIRPDNTILSTYVADAEFTFIGTGPLGEKQTPGLLTRFFSWLF